MLDLSKTAQMGSEFENQWSESRVSGFRGSELRV